MTIKGRFTSLFSFGKRLPTARINIYILVATVAVLLPLIILNVLLLSRLETARQQSSIDRSSADATFIARNISYRLDDMESTLHLLADMPELKRRDFQAFETIADQALLRANYRSIILPITDGPVLNPAINQDNLPFFTTISREMRKAVDRGEREVSGFTYNTATESWMYYVAVILPQHPSEIPNALVLIKTAQNLKQVLSPEILNSNWSVALLNEDAQVIASFANAEQDKPDGIEKTKDVLKALQQAGGQLITNGAIYISKPVPERDWHILVWSPLHPSTNVIAQTFTYLAVGSIAIFALALACAYYVGRHLRRAIHSLSQMAVEVGEGKLVPPIETRIEELDHVARALTTASYDRHLAQEHGEIILQELVHRSKNTIALLQAIMRQLSKEATSVEAYHKSVDQRMRGFAKSMSELATVQWSGVDLQKFVASHLEVFGVLGEKINVDGPSIMISPTAAQNLGLVIHELVTNSIKYGALSEDNGVAQIRWGLSKESSDTAEERFSICWIDQGTKISTDTNFSGFGSTIIERHAEYAFSGNVKINYNHGQFHWHLNCASKNMLDIRPTKSR
jgi:two-component sensor histidine kinase